MLYIPNSPTGLVGFSRLCNGDVFEVQLKLSNQKWKARCRVERQQQVWQDNDVSSNQSECTKLMLHCYLYRLFSLDELWMN